MGVQRTPRMTLCKQCQVIFEGAVEPRLKNEVDHPHHSTFSSLKEALESGCVLCTRAWSNVNSTTRLKVEQSCPVSLYIVEQRPKDKGIWIQIIFVKERIYTMIVAQGGEAFTDVGLDARHIARCEPSESTNSVLALGQAYRWFMSCRFFHPHCGYFSRKEKCFPTRLLDVGLNGCERWRLVLPAEDKLESLQYMTLSHRWGSEPFIKLQKSNIDLFRVGERIKDLPRTFKDAIEVVRRFSVRYLWIDSLCVRY